MSEMNIHTKSAVAQLRGCAEAAGEIMGFPSVTPEWFAGAFLVARRTDGADGSPVTYEPDITIGGSDTLLAGVLADLFEMRPAVYDRARRIYEHRMKSQTVKNE